jgi:protein TonB
MKICLPLCKRRVGGSALSFILIGTGLAAAQTAPLPSAPTATSDSVEKVIDNKVYTYVEQMPQLPGGGGSLAIVRAIQSHVKYPAAALVHHIQGRVLVEFVVGKNGKVRKARVAEGIGGGCDEAVLAAVQQLPRFKPGTQQGKPVAVGFTVPVTFKLPD